MSYGQSTDEVIEMDKTTLTSEEELIVSRFRELSGDGKQKLVDYLKG